MIVGVAIKHRRTGEVFAMTKPARHFNLLEQLRSDGKFEFTHGEQGFLTDEGTFIDRFQARGYVELNGQPTLHRVGTRDLLSEDLW
jgi:hypothetical protein